MEICFATLAAKEKSVRTPDGLMRLRHRKNFRIPRAVKRQVQDYIWTAQTAPEFARLPTYHSAELMCWGSTAGEFIIMFSDILVISPEAYGALRYQMWRERVLLFPNKHLRNQISRNSAWQMARMGLSYVFKAIGNRKETRGWKVHTWLVPQALPWPNICLHDWRLRLKSIL